MKTVWQDIRFGVRTLLKYRGFTAVTVLVLALGIGAITAIFSVVNALLLRPLAYEGPERIVMVWEANTKRGWGLAPTSYPTFTDLREQSDSLAALGAFTDANFNITGGDEPERVKGMRTSAGVFSALGVRPLRGRAFLPGEDERPGGGRVLLLSHGLWQRRFGGDPSVVGRTVALNGESYEVVGVMPRGFQFPPAFTADIAGSRITIPSADVWVPLTPDAVPQARDLRSLFMIGRLKNGVTHEQAQGRMDAAARQLEEQFPNFNAGMELKLIPLQRQVAGDVRFPLLVLLGAVGFILLIACANVASLLLARAVGRRQEMAVRSALGATRRRLVQQLLTESVLLGLAGAVSGLLLAWWGLKLLVRLRPANLPRVEEVGVDANVLLFTLAASLLTAVFFGLAPALQSSRADLHETLKEGGRHPGGGTGRRRLRSALVVAEVALSLVLLVAAGLMIRSLLRLQQVDPGFNPRGVLALEVFLPESKYPEAHHQKAFQQQMLERVRALPGVERAATVDNLPFGEHEVSFSFTIEGQPPPDPSARPRAYFRAVSPDYFRAMGVRLIDGRAFTEQDTAETQGVAVVNETMAARHWPGESPINKRFKQGRPESKNPWLTVVGVVGAVSHTALSVAPQPEIYVPYLQRTGPSFTLVARAASDPRATIPAVQRAASELDSDLPASNVLLMDDLVSKTVAQPRLYTVLLVVFASLAVVLAAAGIYGVMAYSTGQRTHEIGIRMALGARPRNILKLVVGQALLLALAGMAAGLALAFALTRVLSSMLYGMSPGDPLTFVASSALILFVALLAAFLPARRAAKVDPLIALRHE